MRRVLYLTIDGVLDHIGYGQVLRIIEALSERGVRYSLVSMERTRNLADEARVATVRARLSERGISWSVGTYREGSARSVAENLAHALALAGKVVRAERVGLVHARGYHGALVARALRAAMGIPYLFDARGLWVDERIEEGRWFTTPQRIKAARRVEHALYRDALAVVTLTALHAGDVARGHRPDAAHPAVIPTCADYDTFRIDPAPSLVRVPEATQRALEGRHVLGIVGSLNRSYLGDVAARLTRAVIDRDSDARLLVLSAQPEAWRACLSDAGVPTASVVTARADHEDMPAWLGLLDFGLLLLTQDVLAKRGSMPTKLAEFFASGVRPVAHGCNAEMRDWVRRAGSGLVLEAVDRAALDAAADRICALETDGATQRARQISAPHFSITAGVSRYETLLRELA